MANTKLSAFPAASSVIASNEFGINEIAGPTTKKVTGQQIKTYVGAGNTNASTVGVGPAGYSVDTYLAGSAITIPTAGAWVVGATYKCGFDMVKTAAGTAAFTMIVRMGTLGTTADAAILTLAFAVGTAAADSGWIDVEVVFRTVGGGTSAVIQGVVHAGHNLGATGLFSTGAAGYGTFNGTSAGFNSTTQTVIGLSVNGGASFAGTNSLVRASLEKYQ